MHKHHFNKLRKFATSLMFLAALQMAIPVHAYAAVAADIEGPKAAVEVVETLQQSVESNDKAVAEDKSEATVAKDAPAEEKPVRETRIKGEDGKSEADLRCTGVYVGSALTENGDTFIGRSEDLNGANRKDFQYVPAADHKDDYYIDIDNGEGKVRFPMPKHTVGYTCIHDDPEEWNGNPAEPAYAACGINDNGVAITATVTIDQSEAAAKNDPYIHGGLAEVVIGDILLGQATSAKNACEVLGDLIDKYGASEGYQIFAADTTGTWMFAGLSGHQWVAFKLPNDKVSVNPNIGGLKYKINLNDTENVMHSKDLQTFAEKQGIVKTFSDGTFDIFGTYGEPISASPRCASRYWQGVEYLTGSPEAADKMVKDPYLFFNPERSKPYSTFDILRTLGFRGQGTAMDSNKGVTWKNDVPGKEITKIYPIGNLNQLQSHFFQVRHDDSMPAELRIIQWECMGPAAFGVYLPFYTGLLNKTPAIYNPGPTDHSAESAMVVNPEAEKSMYYTMNDLNKLAMFAQSKGADMTKLRSYLDDIQKELIDQQKDIEQAMLRLPKGEYSAAANKMCEVLSNNLHQKALKLNALLRDYIKAGDFTKPFTFDKVATPLPYASEMLDSHGDFKDLPKDEARKLNYGEDVRYKVLKGEDQVVTPGKSFFFEINRNPEAGIEVYVNGKLVDPSNYVITKGSTIVTFTPEYSKTLKAGVHAFRINYKDGGYAVADFTVAQAQGSASAAKQTKKTALSAKAHKGTLPQTSDASLHAGAVVAFMGVCVLTLAIKKRFNA